MKHRTYNTVNGIMAAHSQGVSIGYSCDCIICQTDPMPIDYYSRNHMSWENILKLLGRKLKKYDEYKVVYGKKSFAIGCTRFNWRTLYRALEFITRP